MGPARGEGGWAEGAGLSARRDLFMPLDPRADDCAAGLLKILLRDNPPPAPRPLPSSSEPLEFVENHQTFPEHSPPPPGPRRGGGRTCAPPGAAGARGPASPRSLPLQSRRAPQPGSNAESSTEDIGRPATSRAARGRGRRPRPRPGFISRESSSVRTRCQHSRTVYGIRTPRGGSSAGRV